MNPDAKRPDDERRRRSAWPFIAGFLIALVLNFGLAFNDFLNFMGPAPRPKFEVIVAAWAGTILVFAVLYWWRHWAAYGALAAYATLFVVLLMGGGIVGPSLCFSAYGYQR